MSRQREFTAKHITIPQDLYDKAMKALKEGKFPGVRDFSGVCEKALDQLLNEG